MDTDSEASGEMSRTPDPAERALAALFWIIVIVIAWAAFYVD